MRIAVSVALVLLMNGCGGGGGGTPNRVGATAAFHAADDFAYQLQNVDPATVRQSAFDVLIIDYSRDGSEAGEWTAQQVAEMKNGPGGRHILLAYMSIGEAEDYRFYWRDEWRPGEPSFIMAANPDWPGNYPVRFGDPRWQQIIFGSSDSYLGRIIRQGFDGVYLDRVDVYQEIDDPAVDERAAMVDFVSALARWARRQKPGFIVVPQNAAELLALPQYREVVDGIGQEELHYGWEGEDGRPAPADVRRQIEGYLDLLRADGKPVLVIDYCTSQAQIDEAYRQSAAKGYLCYCPPRDLDALVVNPGHEPD